MTKPGLSESALPRQRYGLIHLAFSLGSQAAVDQLTATLVAAGYELVGGPRVTGDGYYESALVVIEELQIELTI